MDMDKWDWADQEYAQWYMCEHTRAYVQISKLMDPVGFEEYTERTKYRF